MRAFFAAASCLLTLAPAAPADAGHRAAHSVQQGARVPLKKDNTGNLVQLFMKLSITDPNNNPETLEKIAETRRALHSLSKEPDTRGMSRAQAATAWNLHRQASILDVHLERWQRALLAYERMKARRDAAAARGANTAVLDRQLVILEQRLKKEEEAARNKVIKALNDGRRRTVRKLED